MQALFELDDRTIIIRRALQWRIHLLRLHKQPQDAELSTEMMQELVNSLTQEFGSVIPSYGGHGSARAGDRNVISYACDGDIATSNACDSEHERLIAEARDVLRQERRCFWEDIQTNNFTTAERDSIKRYEEQQDRITSEIINCGVCIAMAWEREKASRLSLQLGGKEIRGDVVPAGFSIQSDLALQLLTRDEEQLGGKGIRSDVVPVGFSMQADLAL